MKTAEDFLYQFKTLETSNGNDAFTAEDAIKAMKVYANQKLDEAADLSIEMIYEKEPEHSQKQGLVLRNFQTTYATPKQSILSLKDKV